MRPLFCGFLPNKPTVMGLKTSAKKLPALPNKIGLLIPIILIIEHSNEKWRRFNLTNWPQEWAYGYGCVYIFCLNEKMEFQLFMFSFLHYMDASWGQWGTSWLGLLLFFSPSHILSDTHTLCQLFNKTCSSCRRGGSAGRRVQPLEMGSKVWNPSCSFFHKFKASFRKIPTPKLPAKTKINQMQQKNRNSL